MPEIMTSRRAPIASSTLPRFATTLFAWLFVSVAMGCANLGTTIPIDATQAADRDRQTGMERIEESEAPSELERWSRLSKEGREHLLLGDTAQAEEALLEAFAVSKQFRESDVRRRVSFGNLERVARRYQDEGAAAAARRVLSIIAVESADLSEFDYPRLSDRLLDLGNLENERGDLDAAAAAYRRALDLRSDKSGAHSPTLIQVLLHLSSIEVSRGEAARAVEFAERAVSLAATHIGDESREHVSALIHAAAANQAAGDLATAESQYKDALAAQRAIEASNYSEAAILNGLAFVELESSRLSEALAHVDNALAILDLLGIQGFERAVILDTKAQIRAAQGRNQEADELFDEVMLHVDSAPYTTQRELFESYEDFLVDQNRLGEARRIRARLDALATPAPANEIETGDGASEEATEAPASSTPETS